MKIVYIAESVIELAPKTGDCVNKPVKTKN
jgi:hypothetical protein